MKSLIVLRSPLSKRKRILGFIKTKKKVLGKINIESFQGELSGKSVKILTSSFIRAKQASKAICTYFKLNEEDTILMDPAIQDLDPEGCLDLIGKIGDVTETVVLIIPSATINMLLQYLIGEYKNLPFGHAKVIKFDVNSWTILSKENIKEGKVKIFKNI